MSTDDPIRVPRWLSALGGVALIAGILALQAAAYTRLVGAHHTRMAEVFPEGSKHVDAYLQRALKADGSNGWAVWLLSKERLYQAMAARADPSRRATLLAEAEALAEQGTDSFNSVNCYKQLASIYLRQSETEEGRQHIKDAERLLQLVTRIKPNDVESIERLGLFKLHAKQWDELEELCDLILRRHPYSANVYYYKAFIASQKRDADGFFLNVRQAYMMMIQQKGPIFFQRQALEDLALKLGLVQKPKESATQP